MNITMEWGTKNIIVPRSEMLEIQTTPVEIRQLDLTEFRYAMHDKQDDADGMSFLHMHEHNPPVTVAGTTLAQVVTIVNGYTVTFEDGLHNVNILGGNSNVADNVIKNSVGVNTANSAGLQDSSSLQAASFGGVVTLDQVNGVDGITFPIGTAGTPVKTVTDARIIMNNQNIKRLAVTSNATFTTGDDISDIKVIGEASTLSFITVEDGAIATRTQFEDCTLAGIMDGNSTLKNSVVWDINYYSGYMHYIALTDSTITLGGGTDAVLLHCYAATAGGLKPTIDMGGIGQSLTMGNYSGDIKLTNKSGDDAVDIYFNAGIVEIDSTVTGGTINIYGGEVINNSTATVNHYRSASKQDVVNAAMI